jgi:hypothetical protein
MIDWPRKYWTLAILAGVTVVLLWLGTEIVDQFAQRAKQRHQSPARYRVHRPGPPTEMPK